MKAKREIILVQHKQCSSAMNAQEKYPFLCAEYKPLEEILLAQLS